MTAYVFAFLLVVAFLVGLRSTIRLARRYRQLLPVLAGADRLIIGAFVVVASTITVTAGVLGALAVRRLLGLEPLVWSAPLTVTLSAIVLFLPAYLEWVVDRVASDRRQ